MGRASRHVVLVTHLVTSVGWLGAVLVYLALDVGAAVGADVDMVRAFYVVMGFVASWVVAPLAVAGVLTGVVNAVVTPWGLLRHYWVVAKLVLSVIACGVLLVELPVVDDLASLAATSTDPRTLPSTLPHSGGGAAVLVVIVVLSVVKPRGLTGLGQRASDRRGSSGRPVGESHRRV